MKVKKISILLAALLCVAVFCMTGCGNSPQAPEAFAVLIYKVEKEQDEDGNVYIMGANLWKSYTVMPTQTIDLPDYDPEQEERDSKMLYKNVYNVSNISSIGSGFSGFGGGAFFESKNKVQFIPYADSTLFVRERTKKTINFFYEGKNIKEYLNETQNETLNTKVKDTYNENFSVNVLDDWFRIFFTNSDSAQKIKVRLYIKSKENPLFTTFTVQISNGSVDYIGEYYPYYYGVSFTLIKSTDLYLEVEKIEDGNSGYSLTALDEERLARENGFNYGIN